MKTLTSYILIASLMLLTGCGHRRDTAVRKNLPGIWNVELAFTNAWGSKSTFTIGPNGEFVCQTVTASDVQVAELAGTFQVKDGMLIETVTNSTQPKIQGRIPFTSRAQIIRADNHEMAVIYDGDTNTVILRKDTK
jgi:hypothetical protein